MRVEVKIWHKTVTWPVLAHAPPPTRLSVSVFDCQFTKHSSPSVLLANNLAADSAANFPPGNLSAPGKTAIKLSEAPA